MAEETKPFTMKIEFNSGAEGWHFPVLPGKVTIKRNGAWKDYTIIGTGKVASLQKPDLAEISFESFFPAHNYPFTSEMYYSDQGVPNPDAYVNDINRWMHSGYPVRFVYTGQNDSYKIWLPMIITSFERWEESGSPGDIFYSLQLKEYVFYAPQKVRAEVRPDGTTELVKEPPPRLDMRVPPKTWTLKPGENLTYVSRMALGDSGRWREIQTLNQLSDAQLNRLPVGMALQLPDRR